MKWTLGLHRRSPIGVALVALVALPSLALLAYSAVELARFERADARLTTFIYAAPQPLAPGVHVRTVALGATLARLNYAETRATPTAPRCPR